MSEQEFALVKDGEFVTADVPGAVEGTVITTMTPAETYHGDWWPLITVGPSNPYRPASYRISGERVVRSWEYDA